ncbi:hypothetical protein C2R82_06215 [Helicobacter pylori]|nr:hypothetical protein C2R82_06215 [Helicobacter pylori]
MVISFRGNRPLLDPDMLQIFTTKEKPRNDYLRWHDSTLKNLKMPKSVFKKPPKFNANPL